MTCTRMETIQDCTQLKMAYVGVVHEKTVPGPKLTQG